MAGEGGPRRLGGRRLGRWKPLVLEPEHPARVRGNGQLLSGTRQRGARADPRQWTALPGPWQWTTKAVFDKICLEATAAGFPETKRITTGTFGLCMNLKDSHSAPPGYGILRRLGGRRLGR